MMLPRTTLMLCAAMLLGGLSGLTVPPQATAAEDARRATPPPGKALVFVFRSEREPVSATVPVSVNGARIGDLANGTFATATVNPGTTFLRSGDRVLTTLALEAEANKSYFVWVEAVPGVSPVRSEMRLVSESSGRRSLESSRFAGIAAVAPVAAAPRAAQPAQAAKPAAKPAAAEPQTSTVSGRGWDIAIIPKGGVFELAEDSQVVGGLTSTYDTTASPALGIEVEWRSEMGFAVGGEIFYYSNDLTAAGGTLSAEQEVLAFTVNGKYYFRAASWFYPFVGVGIGFTDTNYSGDLSGGASGLAYQALAGMEFRFKHFGVYLMGKYLASTTEDSSGEEVEVGGTGILAGVSFIF